MGSSTGYAVKRQVNRFLAVLRKYYESGFKLSIVITLIWLIVSTLVIFNWIYVVYPEMGSGFWLVFARTHILLAILPLAMAGVDGGS